MMQRLARLAQGSFGEKLILMLAISFPVDILIKFGTIRELGFPGGLVLVLARSTFDAVLFTALWHFIFRGKSPPADPPTPT